MELSRHFHAQLNPKKMEINEIKKLLYKHKPIATKVGKNDFGILYRCFTADAILGMHSFHFFVPQKEIMDAEKISDPSGEPPFADEMDGHLLIRYLITE